MDSLGRHIIIELYNCDQQKIDDVVIVQKTMEQAAVEAGATLINTTFHHFAPMGVSGVVVIQESHLSIHTWPEYGFASVDIFTCGESVDPWKAVQVIKDTLSASHHSAVEMLRGQKSQLTKTVIPAYKHAASPSKNIQVRRQIWFTERTNDYALSIKHKGGLLYKKHTAYQRIEVYDTENFGKMLVLDGVIVLTEKDGFVYHEMIAHVPLLSHSAPANVLILGGGDGAVATEVLKHERVQHVAIFEIDNEIPLVVKNHFPDLHKALNHSKVKLYLEDIVNGTFNFGITKYDLIIDDLHSPFNREETTNTYAHLEKLKAVLNKDGLLVTSVGSPHLDKNKFKTNVAALHKIFGKQGVAFYLATIPTFPTGLWCFALCSEAINKEVILQYSSINEFVAAQKFQYYTPEIHKAAFVLPAYLRDMLD